MAAAEYKYGDMDITDQEATWKGFMADTQWGGFASVLIVAYLTFTLATGLNWLVALILCAGAGVIGGLAMGMGGAWVATVVGLAAIAVLVQIVITLATAFI